MPELCDLLIGRTTISQVIDRASIYKGQWQGVKDCFQNWWLIVRCSWIGGGIGSIPGISASVIDWLAYGHALKTEKGARQTFGKGDVRGVIASESSNNAKEGGALVPTIAFGVPGSATMAILLGAFLIHGLVPGPDMLHKHLDVTYTMVWSVALANILGAGLCYAFSPQFAKLATLRYTLILPAVLSVVYIGAFAASPQLGRPVLTAAVRRDRLAHEAAPVAAAAAGAGPRAGRLDRALHVHLGRALRHFLDVAAGGGRSADHVDRRPAAAADRRTSAGRAASCGWHRSFQTPKFHPSQLFTMVFIAVIGTLVVVALPWHFSAKLVPLVVGTHRAHGRGL